MGLDKGKDVQIGVEKATRQAKKHLINVPIVHNTIAHQVYCKFKAAQVMIKPAPNGSGIIAGGPVRAILELAGVPNASSKILGKTKNKIVIAEATLGALRTLLPTKRNVVENKKIESTKESVVETAVKSVIKNKAVKE
jgi:small subunit ribosomal protein S5